MYTELNHFYLLLLLFFNLFYFLFIAFAMYRRIKMFRKNWTLALFLQKQKEHCKKKNKILSKVGDYSQLWSYARAECFRSFLDQKKNLGFLAKWLKFTKKETLILQKQTRFSTHSLEYLIKKNTILIQYEYLKKRLYWFFSLFFLILTCCFYGTVSNFLCSDFTIYNIFTNSTADVPTFYKISATWSNHEGSLLLWCWLLSFTSLLFCISICENSLFRVFSFYPIKG